MRDGFEIDEAVGSQQVGSPAGCPISRRCDTLRLVPPSGVAFRDRATGRRRQSSDVAAVDLSKKPPVGVSPSVGGSGLAGRRERGGILGRPLRPQASACVHLPLRV